MSSPQVVVRLPRAGDGQQMGEVHVLAWQVGYRGIVPDPYLDSIDPVARGTGWEDHLDDAFPETAVAEVDAAPETLCELWMLNVHPDFWGHGVSQALMAHVLERLRNSQNEPTVALWVLEQNGRGRRFYEKEGWSPDGRRKTDDIGGAELVEVRYTRAL